MANRKLTELPTLAPINFDSTDLLYIVDVQAKGGDGESKSIPYSLLAGDSLFSLSAYDTQNTLNVDFLSGSIVTNITDIANLQSGGSTQASNILYLSGEIDLNRTDLDTLSTDFQNADVSQLTTDVLEISGGLDALSATVLEIEDDPETEANVNFLSGSIDSLSGSIDFLSGAIDGNTDTITNIRTISGFNGTVSTTTTLTATHFVPIIINGSTYNLLLNQ